MAIGSADQWPGVRVLGPPPDLTQAPPALPRIRAPTSRASLRETSDSQADNLPETRRRTLVPAGTVRPMDQQVPDTVLADVIGQSNARLVSCHRELITGSSGAATGEISLLTGVVRTGATDTPFRIVRKSVRPLSSGRHAPYANDPAHWAYWRREPLAYASGMLPSGPGLAAPRCHGVVDNVIYLAETTGNTESPETAAARLGAWQATATMPAVDWLADHQLSQRIAASDLDWSLVDADPRMAAIWQDRHELLNRLEHVPRVPVHGDFSAGNLIALDDATTVALDWATFGIGPVGADLASLALSAHSDLLELYLAGLNNQFAKSDVELGYRATLALTGASRTHWMLSQGIQPTDDYIEFVAAQVP